MEEQYKKVEWGEEDVIAFRGDQLKKSKLILESLKHSIRYDSWGKELTQTFSTKLNINSKNVIFGNNSEPFSKWFEDGVDCKIMRAYDSKGWRKGKIRVKLTVEFELWEETDESDSPLDNFREQ